MSGFHDMGVLSTPPAPTNTFGYGFRDEGKEKEGDALECGTLPEKSKAHFPGPMYLP